MDGIISIPVSVHPAADLFPMMTDTELAGLADDIRENGLLHPIVIDADGVLIDGRNRLRACEIAGVAPVYTQLNGHDPLAFIVSANLNRRNLNKGQQAVALAMIYPEPEKGGRGNKGKASVSDGFSQTRLKEARAIVRHSRALAEEVLADRLKFDEALERVAEERQRSGSREAQIAELRRAAPDIAEMVADERLTAEAGAMELFQRRRQIQDRIDGAVESLSWLKSIPTRVAIFDDGVTLEPEEFALLRRDPKDYRPLDGISHDEIDEAMVALRKLKAMKQKAR